MEEQERQRKKDVAAREKLRLLDERTRPVQIQTHEASVREQAGELNILHMHICFTPD